jgi:hypothetical protein
MSLAAVRLNRPLNRSHYWPPSPPAALVCRDIGAAFVVRDHDGQKLAL